METHGHMLAPEARAAAGSFHFVQCPECGATHLNPPIPPEALEAYYPDYYLPYRGPAAWGRFAPLAARGQAITDRKRVRRALAAIGHARGAHVFDVGCGHPTFLRQLRDRGPELKLTGIDFVDSGWRDDRAAWDGIELIQADPAVYEADEPFDLITMWHYLEHDYHPVDTLRRMRAVSHRGTRLLIEVPDLNSLSRRRYGANWEGWHAPRHTVLYTRDVLARTLERAGWTVVSHTTRGTLDTFALWWMSAMERRGIDWNTSMEGRFVPFMVGRILSAPLFMLEGVLPHGVQLVEARPADE
jgi:ubiquinone/menaquinone biosynthesis C-methylase UbiE